MTSQTNETLLGSAYGRTPGKPDETLVHCGPGTPGGELLRRYWQPIALTSEATSTPRLIKILGEELVLFRDGAGQAGLLYPRCSHRGTSLLYGKVEEDGIRCCYHGWKFAPDGRCMDAPCEPETSSVRRDVRQPWYPVEEHFGLVFAYMGPPDRKPPFPRLSVAENMSSDEEMVAVHSTSAPNGPDPKLAARQDYNWTHALDNFIDPFHVVVLHCRINGIQFVEGLGIMPQVRFEYSENGVRAIATRRLPDQRIHQRISEVMLPNMHCTPGITDDDFGVPPVGWVVPSDDTSYSSFILKRIKRGGEPAAFLKKIGMMTEDWGPKHGRPFFEWTLEEHQHWQTDYEAQKGQGDITLHSEEHLASSDVGISMMRRIFRKQASVVQAGGDPIGVDCSQPYFIDVVACNSIYTEEGDDVTPRRVASRRIV